MLLLIPFSTNRPRKRMPIATYSLMGANVAFFGVQCLFDNFGVKTFGFVPSHPSLLTAVTAMFAHGGIGHLVGNLLFLWLFGTIAEDVLGPGVFLGFYFGGEIGAMLLDVNMSRWLMPGSLEVPRLGASGAIAGILGLAAYCLPQALVRIWYFAWFMIIFVRSGTFEVRAAVFLWLWVGLQMVGAALQHLLHLEGGVAYWAHLGGFVAGMGTAAAFGLRRLVGKKDLLEEARQVSTEYTAMRPIKDLSKLANEDSRDPEVWAALAQAAETAGKTDDALRAYQEVIPLLLKAGQRPRAARAFLAAIGHAPDFVVGAEEMFEMAGTLADMGESLAAAKAFQRMAGCYPESPQAELALARACEIATDSLGDAALFDECYAALCERFPSSAWRELLKAPRQAEPVGAA